MSHVMTYLTLQEKHQLLMNRVHTLLCWHAALTGYKANNSEHTPIIDPRSNPMFYGLTDDRSTQEIAEDVESIWGDIKEQVIKELLEV